MNDLIVTAGNKVTEADVPAARLGTRFGRLDLLSQLALLAVESLAICFEAIPRDRVGICLAARGGSISTDALYWLGREGAGGPSPTLFAYTLPSAAVGEIAIRHRLTGPNLCFVGADSFAIAESAAMIRSFEADGCVCVACHVLTPAAAALVGVKPQASACAVFLTRAATGKSITPAIALRENDRDMESLYAKFSAQKFAS